MSSLDKGRERERFGVGGKSVRSFCREGKLNFYGWKRLPRSKQEE